MKALRSLLVAVLAVLPATASAGRRQAPPPGVQAGMPGGLGPRLAQAARAPASAQPGSPAPQASRESLARVAGAVADERASGAPAEAAATFFDVGSPKAYAAAAAVGVVGAATGGAGLPAAYALVRVGADPKRPPGEAVPSLRDRAVQNFEAGLTVPVAMMLGPFLSFFAGDTPALPLLWAAIATGVSGAMEQMVGQARSRVVGGWQASHDQKFRIDPGTGQLKDVRGTNKEYGKDRYEVFEPGHVGTLERLSYRLAAAATALYWLGDAPSAHAWLFGGALTASFLYHDWKRSRRRPYVQSADDRAHAWRFNQR